MPIHRTIKNVVHNYTYAEVKVREATSNDPWGPSSSLMSEIAQLTNNPMAYSETMSMIWRRLNDHGKNWRHVYKSLVLLDYLIHHGSERVARDCRTNIIAIRTLADFQHVDENGRDNGLAVREKARQLAILLGDDERLRGERIHAHETRERFGANSYGATIREDPSNFESSRVAERHTSSTGPHTTQFASPAPVNTTSHRELSTHRPTATNPDMDVVRPSTSGEEELQLQLALAMSKEEHEEDMKRRKADELKLQLAIEESKKTARLDGRLEQAPKVKKTPQPATNLSSNPPAYASTGSVPLEAMMVDPWASPARPSASVSAAPSRSGPWGQVIEPSSDPWGVPRSSSPVYTEVRRDTVSTLAPWEEVEAKLARDNANRPTAAGPVAKTRGQPLITPDDDFASLTVHSKSDNNNGAMSSIPLYDNSASVTAGAGFNLLDMSDDDLMSVPKNTETPVKKVTPEQFLGPNAKLVDFDDLVSKPTPASLMNPFAMTIGKQSTVANPFVARAKEEEQSRKVSINQLQASTASGFGSAQPPPVAMAPSTVYPTLAVVYTPQTVPMPQQGYNPFL